MISLVIRSTIGFKIPIIFSTLTQETALSNILIFSWKGNITSFDSSSVCNTTLFKKNTALIEKISDTDEPGPSETKKHTNSRNKIFTPEELVKAVNSGLSKDEEIFLSSESEYLPLNLESERNEDQNEDLQSAVYSQDSGKDTNPSLTPVGSPIWRPTSYSPNEIAYIRLTKKRKIRI